MVTGERELSLVLTVTSKVSSSPQRQDWKFSGSYRDRVSK